MRAFHGYCQSVYFPRSFHINSISTGTFVWPVQRLSEVFAGRGDRALLNFKYPPMSRVVNIQYSSCIYCRIFGIYKVIFSVFRICKLSNRMITKIPYPLYFCPQVHPDYHQSTALAPSISNYHLQPIQCLVKAIAALNGRTSSSPPSLARSILGLFAVTAQLSGIITLYRG